LPRFAAGILPRGLPRRKLTSGWLKPSGAAAVRRKLRILLKVNMRIKYWFLLSRVPFLSVMIAPYILGAILASRFLCRFNWPVFFLGLWGAVLVQLIAHYSGEVYDLPEDRLSVKLEKNFFTGGSQVLVENLIPVKKVKYLIAIVLSLALVCGLILQFYYKCGPWTLALGFSGIFCAYFYSRPPLRLVRRGVGEVLIAYAFGWLSVSAGFYLQAGRFNWLATLISLPIAYSVINLILINEYPDYPADKQVLKQNLLVRSGKKRGALLYAWLVVFQVAAFLLALNKGLPAKTGIFYLPVLAISVILAYQMLKGAYDDRHKLEKMCAGTILVNLGITFSCILGLLFI
jgi:1,4-dihydroxy-2-naphthoate polyprenyltransferase